MVWDTSLAPVKRRKGGNRALRCTAGGGASESRKGSPQRDSSKKPSAKGKPAEAKKLKSTKGKANATKAKAIKEVNATADKGHPQKKVTKKQKVHRHHLERARRWCGARAVL